MMTGENESPNIIPDFLSGRIPSQSALNQPPVITMIPLSPRCLQQNEPLQWPYKTQLTDWHTS